MSQENVELARGCAEAYNRRDIDALIKLSSPRLELVPYLASMIETKTYRGHDGLRQYFEDAASAWEVIEVRLQQVRAFGDHVLATGELYGKGRASGMEVVLPHAWVVTIAGGKVVRIHTHETEAAALEAVGLSE